MGYFTTINVVQMFKNEIPYGDGWVGRRDDWSVVIHLIPQHVGQCFVYVGVTKGRSTDGVWFLLAQIEDLIVNITICRNDWVREYASRMLRTDDQIQRWLYDIVCHMPPLAPPHASRSTEQVEHILGTVQFQY